MQALDHLLGPSTATATATTTATATDLPATLRSALAPGSPPNPALDALVDSYRTYHLVLVALGTVFVALLLTLAWYSGTQVWRSTVWRSKGRRWSFERKTYLFFAASSFALAALLGLVVASNLGNALAPRTGFSGAIATIEPSPRGTQEAALHQSFETWLRSGSDQVPPLVQQRIDDRLAWQRPKAVASSIALVASVALGARAWRSLIRRSRVRPTPTGGDRAVLAAGVGGGLASLVLVLVLMVLGNTQATVAPLSMTLFVG